MATTTSVFFSGSFLSLGTGEGTAGGSLLFLSLITAQNKRNQYQLTEDKIEPHFHNKP